MTDAHVTRFDHVAIAVPDLRAAVHLFQDLLGGEFVAGGDDEGLGIRTIQFRFPNGAKIELMTPLRSDSYLQAFLDKRGPGFHHAALFVDDLQLAIARMEADGYEVVDISTDRPTWFEAFLRPRSAFGALIQLVQTTRDWSEPHGNVTVEQVLDGEVVWIDSTPTLRSEISA